MRGKCAVCGVEIYDSAEDTPREPICTALGAGGCYDWAVRLAFRPTWDYATDIESSCRTDYSLFTVGGFEAAS